MRAREGERWGVGLVGSVDDATTLSWDRVREETHRVVCECSPWQGCVHTWAHACTWVHACLEVLETGAPVLWLHGGWGRLLFGQFLFSVKYCPRQDTHALESLLPRLLEVTGLVSDRKCFAVVVCFASASLDLTTHRQHGWHRGVFRSFLT